VRVKQTELVRKTVDSKKGSSDENSGTLEYNRGFQRRIETSVTSSTAVSSTTAISLNIGIKKAGKLGGGGGFEQSVTVSRANADSKTNANTTTTTLKSTIKFGVLPGTRTDLICSYNDVEFQGHFKHVFKPSGPVLIIDVDASETSYKYLPWDNPKARAGLDAS
jgi:hypothetical protein